MHRRRHGVIGFDEAEIKEAIDDDVADYMIEALGKVRDSEVGGS
jgi:hypothetical protein